MAHQEFLVGELYVRSELVGKVEDLPGPGPIIPVQVVVATQEAVEQMDVEKLKQVTIEIPYSGSVAKDLKKAAFLIIEDLCDYRQDPAGYKKWLEKKRQKDLERRGAPPPKMMNIEEYIAGMEEWQKILGHHLDAACELAELERLFEEPPGLSGGGSFRKVNPLGNSRSRSKSINGLILYHGTSTRFLAEILGKGLRPGSGFIYLSDDPRMAEHFARQTGEGPVVIVVRVRDTSHLGPDLNMYHEPPDWLTEKYGVGTDYPLWGAVAGPKHEGDWQTSLKEVNSVTYDGRIPSKDVEFGWTVSA